MCREADIGFRSTRNTRIERLWLEVGKRFGRLWRAFFLRLERLHGLDVENEHHLWLLHSLFLDEINADVDTFSREWARKPISGPGTHYQSPKVCVCLSALIHWMTHVACIRICGSLGRHSTVCMTQTTAKMSMHPSYGGIMGWTTSKNIYVGAYSIYIPMLTMLVADIPLDALSDSDDEHSDIDELEEHLAREGLEDLSADDLAQILPHDIDLVDLEQRIAADQGSNIKHDAIDTPDAASPFTDEGAVAFFACLSELEGTHFIPEHLGISAEELGGAGYPLFEVLEVGRGRKQMEVELPLPFWYPRALRWTQALELMNTMVAV